MVSVHLQERGGEESVARAFSRKYQRKQQKSEESDNLFCIFSKNFVVLLGFDAANGARGAEQEKTGG